MERLVLRYQNFLQALHTLEESSIMLRQIDNEKLYKMVRDSQIQRFEYCYELLWQLLKSYLEKIYGIKANTPAQIFKECYKMELIQKIDETDLLNMVRDHNQNFS